MILSSEDFEKVKRWETDGVGPNYAKNIDERTEMEKRLGITLRPVTQDRIRAAGEGGEFTPATVAEEDEDKQRSIRLLELSLAMTRGRDRYDR